MEKVAVIGGGFSGLMTARELQKAGYEVTLYEKECYTGGHCLSLPTGGTMIETGCVFGTAPALETLCEELDVDVQKSYFYRQFLDEKIQKVSQIDEMVISRFRDEYKRLSTVLSAYEPDLKTAGFHHIPDELCVDFRSWCDKQDFQALPEVYESYFTGFGYGRLSDTAAYYVLKNLDLPTLQILVESRKLLTFPRGISRLCEALAISLKDIRYQNPVNKIRTGKGITLSSQSGQEQFDRVVITTALPEGTVEDTWFSSVLSRYRLYSSNALIYAISDCGLIDCFFKGHYEKTGKIRLLHINGSSGGNQLVTAYSSGDLPLKDLDRSMRNTFSLMNIGNPRLTAWKKWSIFPHVDIESLGRGFYEELDAHQGENGIYLAGALACSASLDKITAFTSSFVRTHF